MVTRIGGLASGMDIDSMVEKLMQAEKAPLNKLYQNKQKYEWQRDAYRDVNKKLKEFDDFLFGNMTLQKDMFKKTATSTSTAITATPTSAANGQTININSVKALAKSATAVGAGKIDGGTEGTAKLKDLNLNLNFDATGNANIEMEVLQSDGKMKDVSIAINQNDSIDDMIKKFKDGTGLSAFYDANSGQIAISTQATGAGEKRDGTSLENYGTEANPNMQLENHVGRETAIFIKNDSSSDFLAGLGFKNTQFLGEGGQNAVININGAEIERSSNTFEIDGFNISLNDTHVSDKPITIVTKTDTDNMVDKIKKFVETYNGLVESFTASTKEKKHRDFQPLTDEQKKDMEENDIKVWEEKAKSGVLRSDSLVTSALSKMRSIMYDGGGSSNSMMNNLYSMGITTSNKTSDNGKLVIDEEKLRASIEKDPEAVFKTFSNSSDDQPGIVQKLRNSINTSVINIEKKAGKAESVNNTFNLGRTLNDVETRISAWKTKLANIEERYWKQFGAMESAINKANQQSASLFSGQAQ